MAKRGLGSMPIDKRRMIAGMGGRAAHEQGRAHEWTSETARAAGAKGLKARRRKKRHTD